VVEGGERGFCTFKASRAAQKYVAGEGLTEPDVGSEMGATCDVNPATANRRDDLLIRLPQPKPLGPPCPCGKTECTTNLGLGQLLLLNTSLRGVQRRQEMLKGHLPRIVYQQVN